MNQNANAFYRRIFDQQINSAKLSTARRLFQVGIENGIFDGRPGSSAVFDMAKRLAEKHTLPLGTRTLGILQVASALVWKVDTFFTFDTNQRKLAKAKGLVGS